MTVLNHITGETSELEFQVLQDSRMDVQPILPLINLNWITYFLSQPV